MDFKVLFGQIGRVVDSGLSSVSSIVTRYPLPSDNCSVMEISGRSATDDVFDFDPSCYRYHTHVSSYPVHDRADCMQLHGPIENRTFENQPKYNIILHQPKSDRMFSLFRCDDVTEAEEIFLLYKQVVPKLALIDSTIFDTGLLTKMCSKLRTPEARGWTPLHIAAAFNLAHFFAEPTFRKFVNAQCDADLRTPLHVAIVNDCFSAVSALLNLDASMDLKDLNGNTILHLAAEFSPSSLQSIFEKMPEQYSLLVNEVNAAGYTALHAACKNNHVEAVQMLLRAGADANISSPNDGYPIHAAVKVSSVSSIQELVARSPGQINLKDSKDGGTPLHWASGVDTTELLLKLGCDANIPNNYGQTPLHIAARRGCLKTMIHLLCNSGFPDLKDKEGETPLHVAARLCSKSIIQVLVVFGADCNLLNEQGESPRHLVCTSGWTNKDHILYYLSAVGSRRCPESLKSRCTEGCISDNKSMFEGIPPEGFETGSQTNLMHEALLATSLQNEIKVKNEDYPIQMETDDPTQAQIRQGTSSQRANGAQIGGRLLCLDGGGIRGVVLTQMLLFLQGECGAQIIDMFDWVAGTSTGGILALGLASGKSIIDIQGLYLRLKDRVFVGKRPYKSDAMDSFLKQEFGEDTRMSSIRRPRVMVTSALVDRQPAEVHLFRNYLSPSRLLGEPELCSSLPEDEVVWECAKRTGAAPSFFKLEGRFIDGGLVSNNPTLDALTELTQLSVTMKATGLCDKRFIVPTLVVSLGTGIQPSRDCSARHLDIAWPSGFIDALTKVPRIATLLNLLVDQATHSDGQVVERSRAWCSAIGVPFFRFSPRMSEVIDLDEKNDETLVNLMWETRAYMFSHKEVVMTLKATLLQKV